MSETPRSDAAANDGSPVLIQAVSRNLERALADAQAEIAALKRGEFICRKCGLRKDGEGPSADF